MWTDECEQRGLCAPILAFVNFTKPFVLEVDASHQGLGAILSQEHQGKVKPVAYASHRSEGQRETWRIIAL